MGIEAKHLTRIDLDLALMQAQLTSLPSMVAEAAKNAQSEWDKNFKIGVNASFSNGTSGGSSSAAASSVGAAASSATETAAKEISVTKAQLESLILSYKTFEATLSRSKIYPAAVKELREEVASAITELESLTGSLDENGKLTGQDAQTHKNYTSQLKEEKGAFAELKTSANDAAGALKNAGASTDQAGTGINNFLGKLADKARWLAAFYLIQMIINGFKSLVDTIKTTESKVVELQRVLNEDIQAPQIQSELYDIAMKYGRTIDEVFESSVLFAQTGKSWNDVLTLTEGTMLALNTAELNVTDATQGLIAVMAQWKLSADDYVSLIDKINKTADDYAVTSEAIVAAMQRSGGTAKAYGMSLDELIGIITALGEATGRSGANLGTAVNSLITYTTRPKMLDLLEEMNIQTTDLQGNLLPVLDIWSQLAQKIKGGDTAFADFMATDQEATDQFLADNEEYQKAIEQTIASGKEVQDIYSIAGAYRKNYFIALLNNLDTAVSAVQNMTDAEGYSMTENEKYMATLQAASNQLKTSWQQLAVQLGEAGFLDFLKFIMDLGIGFATLIKYTGGLGNMFLFLLGILIMIKQQQITKFFTELSTSVVGFFTKLKAGILSVETLAGGFGLLLMAISLVVAAVKGLDAAFDQNKAKMLEESRAIRDNISSVNDLMGQYRQLLNSADYKSGKKEALEQEKTLYEDINKLLGDQAVAIDLTSKKTAEKVEILRQEQLEFVKSQRQKLKDAYDLSVYDLTSYIPVSFADSTAINTAFGNFTGTSKFTELLGAVKASGASGAIDMLTKWADHFRDMGEYGVKALTAVNSLMGQYQAKLDAAAEARKNWLSNEAMGEVLERSKQVTIDSVEAYEAYIKTVDDAAAAGKISAEYATYLKDAIASLWPEFSKASDSTLKYNEALNEGSQSQELFAQSLESIRASIKAMTDELDTAQGSIKTLQSIIDEYNETGLMSVDMLQQLMELEPEYIALLDISSSGISINEEATNKLIEAKMKLIEANIDLKEAEYANAIASEFSAYATDEAYDAANNAASASNNAASGLQNLIASAYSSGWSVEQLAQMLVNLGYAQSATGSKALAMASQILTASQAMYNLRAAAGSTLSTLASFGGLISTGSTGKSSGGGGGSGEDPQIKILEARKKAIEELADAQIKALKDTQEAEDRKRKHDEYMASRSEILSDIRRAQSRSGVDARKDEYESEKKLQKLDQDWRDQLKDWNTEDQIAAIEKWRDAEIKAIEAVIEALRNASSGGGGGSGMAETAISSETQKLIDARQKLVDILLQTNDENFAASLAQFLREFDNVFGEDVDFTKYVTIKNAEGDYEAIKTDWNTFKNDNGEEWAIHYRVILDENTGKDMTPEQINEYINGLLKKATNEDELLQLDKDGLGILLRVNPDFNSEDPSSVLQENEWQASVEALSGAITQMLEDWSNGTLDAQKSVEDSFGVVQQSAKDTGVVIEDAFTTAADNSGGAFVTAAATYGGQAYQQWKTNLINPLAADIAALGGSLGAVIATLGLSGGAGMSGIMALLSGGSGSKITYNNQNNNLSIHGNGGSTVDSLNKWQI